MSLSFPTGQTKTGTIKSGYPRHPESRHMCHCGDQRMLDDIGSCIRCGRFPPETVAETWERRKRQIAARAKRIEEAA